MTDLDSALAIVAAVSAGVLALTALWIAVQSTRLARSTLDAVETARHALDATQRADVVPVKWERDAGDTTPRGYRVVNVGRGPAYAVTIEVAIGGSVLASHQLPVLPSGELWSYDEMLAVSEEPAPTVPGRPPVFRARWIDACGDARASAWVELA